MFSNIVATFMPNHEVDVSDILQFYNASTSLRPMHTFMPFNTLTLRGYMLNTAYIPVQLFGWCVEWQRALNNIERRHSEMDCALIVRVRIVPNNKRFYARVARNRNVMVSSRWRCDAHFVAQLEYRMSSTNIWYNPTILGVIVHFLGTKLHVRAYHVPKDMRKRLTKDELMLVDDPFWLEATAQFMGKTLFRGWCSDAKTAKKRYANLLSSTRTYADTRKAANEIIDCQINPRLYDTEGNEEQ